MTHLGKPMWPADGITKADLIGYYIAVWPWIGPHLADRPLSLVRHPHGAGGVAFYQKDFPDAPPWVRTVDLGRHGQELHYCIADNLATLVWAANLGSLEVHPWLSTASAPDLPTHIVIDLDPTPPTGFAEACQVALAFKLLLDKLGMEAFPKVSGSTGIHIAVPLERGYTFEAASAFIANLGEVICQALPGLATLERRVAKRGPRVYIDHMQNRRGATIASVYSLRPSPHAPVSMPCTWDELPGLSPSAFTIGTAEARLRAVGDLYAPLLDPAARQRLPPDLLE